MNFTTHAMFGIVVASIFFGKPEAILLVGLGSALPDLDREYGFLSKESFKNFEVHRAACHNFVFLGIIYLINPYLALGAFLHTLLDALNSARDRGVEWLFPFTRMLTRAVYDSNGERLPLDPKHKLYLLQNEMRILTEQTTADIKPGPKTVPWRRTYGPTLSGGLFDHCIFFCSAVLFLFLLCISASGVKEFIDLSNLQLPVSFALPFIVASAGVVNYFMTGEIDRKRIFREFKRTNTLYKVLFIISVALMVSSIVIAAVLNSASFFSMVASLTIPIIATLLIAGVAFAVVKLHLSRASLRDKAEPIIF